MSKLKAMTVYKANVSEHYSEYADYYSSLGIHDGQEYLCLGEITNMPDHYAFVSNNPGKIVWGLHDDMFEEEE